MISSFKVQNFRLFEDVSIRKLSRVNLIVGKNNSGKSALLEALLLYFSKMSNNDLVDLIYARHENIGGRRSINSRSSAFNPIRHFFKDHKTPQLFEKGFALSSPVDSFEVKLAAYVTEESPDNRFLRRLVTKEECEEQGLTPEVDDIFLIVQHSDGRVTRVMNINDELRDFRRRPSYLNRVNNTLVQYVPTSGLTSSKASSLWDSISLTDLESEVVKGLQLIEPSTSGLTFVENDDGVRSLEGRIPLVKVDGVDEPIPLKSLGDGMTRIFHVILSLVCAKDGVLIVDEFENGLHWSVQEGAWNIVFKLAKKLNVQVFTTSHSRDCVAAFEKSWRNVPEEGAFLRVYKENGYSQFKEYDLELLSDSVDTDVEVR
ncbi:chromosome segregation protein [Enterobacter hormaechei]|uniref:AAA family ATPase n=1 Tax=Enterobacter hormaechei TaxID=158836 RepID=UPI0007916002|nr:AAA family ATPase [Enterobacter hormaechei]MCM7446715.1 AAA family ATPase [Enterobacter hormaechei]CZY47144.1 chromosome segregation protein [Enterobacter hormaechei]